MAPNDAALVTVVTATNRAGSFFAEAMASLGAQTEQRFELIVVDDGSPFPEAIVEAVAAVPGATVIRQEAAGPAAARNAAIARATGDWLAFLDDDDRWHPERLEAQLADLATHPEAVASFCGMRTIDADGAVLIDADQIAVDGPDDIARRRTGIILPNLVIRRDVVADVGGFDESLHLAEDLDLLLKVSERGPVVFEPRALVDYRSHGANVTGRHRELVAAIDTVLRRHRGRAQSPSLVAAYDESIRKNERFAWWSAGRAAKARARERRFAAAAGEMWWALRTAPRGLVDGLVRRARGIRY